MAATPTYLRFFPKPTPYENQSAAMERIEDVPEDKGPDDVLQERNDDENRHRRDEPDEYEEERLPAVHTRPLDGPPQKSTGGFEPLGALSRHGRFDASDRLDDRANLIAGLYRCRARCPGAEQIARL